MISMFRKTEVSWNTNTYWRDLSKESAQINLTDNSPQLLFNWQAVYNIEKLNKNPEKYLRTDFYYKNVDFESNILNNTNLEDVDWGKTFGTLNIPDSLKSWTYWPKMNGYQLSGNFLNPFSKQFLQFEFSRWGPTPYNSDNWYEDEDIDTNMEYYPLSIFMINNYIDLNDIDNPIKSKNLFLIHRLYWFH